MNLKGLGNIVGAFITLGIVAIVFAKPDAIAQTFKGATGLVSALNRPITGR